MASSAHITKSAWGKASKGFATYLNIAGQEIKKKTAMNLADACAEFMANEDWDWPRGTRFDATRVSDHRAVRGSNTYASGYHGGDAMHPWYSGNLHDSFAVGVMDGTRIMAARYMTPGATEFQTYKGQVVDGVNAGEEALHRAAHTFAAGQAGDTLRAVMVIGVPYAADVNEMPEHAGYVEFMEHEFYTTIMPKVESLRKIKLKLK